MGTERARLATKTDVEEVLRLAEQLYASMDTRTYPSWRAAARLDLLDRIGQDLVAVVIDGDDGTLASMAVAVVGRGIRSPRRPTTATAYIEWMATDSSRRGEGLGTAVLTMLLAELRKRDVTTVGLNSSEAALSFYRRAGFTAEGPAAMSLRLQPVPAEAAPLSP